MENSTKDRVALVIGVRTALRIAGWSALTGAAMTLLILYVLL